MHRAHSLHEESPRKVFSILILCLSLVLFTNCGGGDGGEDQPSGDTFGTASGHLIVPPNFSQEEEPNDSIPEAQGATENSVISGAISAGDPGFFPTGLPLVNVGDLYKLDSTAKTNVTLAIAEDDLESIDLDLLLMDPSGNVIDASEGSTSTEFLQTSPGGVFLVGVRAFQGASAYVLSFNSSTGLPDSLCGIPSPGADFVPGEALVKWRDVGQVSARQAETIATSHGFERVIAFPGGVELLRLSMPGEHRYSSRAAGKLALPNGERRALMTLTLDSLRRLARDPLVEYAEPNFLRKPTRTPNDPAFDLQWHYGLINLPQAWDMATGSDGVTCALIDTGVLLEHPDLAARLVQGYDFISDPLQANDGNGVDPDPNDPGDDPRGQSSSFHGTHVAGTLGAVTNNRTGVAGVTWQTRIMPLRALGADGGTDADITQAIRYAACLPNISGTVPARNADIVNMSFGGPGYSQTLQNAVRDARGQGVILVASAGNENSSEASFPASLDGVISVAAVDLNSRKATYSNFGPSIDLAAPGGDTGADLNGDGYVDGVLSTLGDDQGEYSYRFYQGTSMACAHFSGVAALMLAVNPNLTPVDLDLLAAGTHPETTTRITRDLGEPGRDDLYGQGLIDAAQALIAAQSVPGGGATLPTGSILAVSTMSLSFDNFISALSFAVTNAGIGTLQVTQITDNASWLILSPSSGTAPITVDAIVDRAGLAPGPYSATIQVKSDAAQGSSLATVHVEMKVGGKTMGDVGTVFLLVLDQETLEPVGQTETDASRNYLFSAGGIAPGTYRVVAGTDRDNDGFICDIEDACGYFPDLVTIKAGQETTGITLLIGEIATPQSANARGIRFNEATFRRLR
jgi:serine protease